jgi:hypothetical protein
MLSSSLTPRPFWLIVRQRTRGMEVLTIGSYKEVLPVFSFNEEAEMFLRFGVSGTGWRVRESTCGELTSVLYASCRDVEHVALDPLPEIVAEGMVGFVSLSRKAFIGVILPSDPTPSVVEGPRIIGVAS